MEHVVQFSASDGHPPEEAHVHVSHVRCIYISYLTAIINATMSTRPSH